MYRIELDIAQVSPPQVGYIDDRPMFVGVAQSLDIRGIIHRGYETPRKPLRKWGFR